MQNLVVYNVQPRQEFALKYYLFLYIPKALCITSWFYFRRKCLSILLAPRQSNKVEKLHHLSQYKRPLLLFSWTGRSLTARPTHSGPKQEALKTGTQTGRGSKRGPKSSKQDALKTGAQNRGRKHEGAKRVLPTVRLKVCF